MGKGRVVKPLFDVHGEILGSRLKYFRIVFLDRFCGVENFYRRNYESIVMSTPEERAGWLENVKEIIRERFPAG